MKRDPLAHKHTIGVCLGCLHSWDGPFFVRQAVYPSYTESTTGNMRAAMYAGYKGGEMRCSSVCAP